MGQGSSAEDDEYEEKEVANFKQKKLKIPVSDRPIYLVNGRMEFGITLEDLIVLSKKLIAVNRSKSLVQFDIKSESADSFLRMFKAQMIPNTAIVVVVGNEQPTFEEFKVCCGALTRVATFFIVVRKQLGVPLPRSYPLDKTLPVYLTMDRAHMLQTKHEDALYDHRTSDYAKKPDPLPIQAYYSTFVWDDEMVRAAFRKLRKLE